MWSDDSQAPPFCLVGLNGELAGRAFPLRLGMTLGRAASSDVFLPDPALRRVHCRITIGARGIEIVSCGAHRGIDVNGEPVTCCRLQDGDIVTVGRFRLHVRPVDASSETVTPPEDVTRHCNQRNASQDSSKREAGGDERTGLVLAIHFRGQGNGEHLPQRLDSILDRAGSILKEAGGQLAARNAKLVEAFWELDNANAEAARAALAVQQHVFDVEESDVRILASVGLAWGPFFATAMGDRGMLLWGSAADRATILALSSAPGTVAIDRTELPAGGQVDKSSSLRGTVAHPGEPSLTNDSFWPIPAHQPQSIEFPQFDPVRVLGVRTFSTGRRIKFFAAVGAEILDRDEILRVLIVSVRHDPESNAVSLRILCFTPLEIGDEIQLRGPAGVTLPLCCRTCAAGDSFEGLTAHLVGCHSLETLSQFLDADLHDPSPILVDSAKSNISAVPRRAA